mmetsp:Transcript_9553/g.22624  ORF Transcript_9553/g.22624 Transcript_9553/m.22624 type:complete len:143 (+) Transcript_9553:142-570(+)
MDWSRIQQGFGCCDPNPVVPVSDTASNSGTLSKNTAYVKTSRSPSVGVGIVFREDRENGGGLYVVAVAKGSPAMQSRQVQPGLKLMAIDDNEVSACNAPDIAPYILGPPGSTVKLTFRDPETDDVFSVLMTRGWAGGNTAEA